MRSADDCCNCVSESADYWGGLSAGVDAASSSPPSGPAGHSFAAIDSASESCPLLLDLLGHGLTVSPALDSMAPTGSGDLLSTSRDAADSQASTSGMAESSGALV